MRDICIEMLRIVSFLNVYELYSFYDSLRNILLQENCRRDVLRDVEDFIFGCI